MVRDTLIPLDRPMSRMVYQKACHVIPKGVNSPVRSFPGLDQTPLIAEWGKEDLIGDVDGYQYIDYCGSWGALIHGHAHPQIVSAAQKRVAQGSSFGVATASEERLARLAISLVPSMEKIRFVSSGTEATMSALRVARGFTKRDLVIKFAGHYHGHSDTLLVQAGSGVVHLTPTSSSAGVPEEFVKNTLCLPFNDFDAIKETFRTQGKNIAAVIVEPIAANMGVVLPTPGFLELLREQTSQAGALLIFDEVITGFRVGLHGAQGLYGISPDMTCLGKIVGGGFPAAAFGGRAEIMNLLAPEGPVYQAGTLSGNPVAMEAGFQSLSLLLDPCFYSELQKKTAMITGPLREWIKDRGANLCINEIGSIFTLFFECKHVRHFEEAKKADLLQFKRFFHALFQQGIYLSPAQHEAQFVSSAHTQEHLQRTADAMINYLETTL